MRKFNEDDYALLVPYEGKFNNAIKSRYVTGLDRTDLDLIYSIYRQVIGGNINTSCSSCVLKMMTGIGRLYFKKKEEIWLLKEQQQDQGDTDS